MKIPWHIIFLSGVIVGFLAFWKGCEPECPECDKIEIVNGEIFPDKPKVEVKTPDIKPPISETPGPQIIYVSNPSEIILQSKYDSLVTAYNTLSNYRRYADSIHFENLIVTYYGETLGYLTDIDIGIIDNRPTLTKTVTITQKEIKESKGLYVGLTIGGNKESFARVAPEITLVTPKRYYQAGYNLMDGTVELGIGIKPW